MSDFGKCSKNTPWPLNEWVEAKIDLYLGASLAIITHKHPLRKSVTVIARFTSGSYIQIFGAINRGVLLASGIHLRVSDALL